MVGPGRRSVGHYTWSPIKSAPGPHWVNPALAVCVHAYSIICLCMQLVCELGKIPGAKFTKTYNKLK